MKTRTTNAISSEANLEKSKNGLKSRARLDSMLTGLYSEGYITSIRREFRIGRKGFYNKQFFAPFLLELEDGSRWIVYNTTSCRERVKEPFWDALNIKVVDSTITKAYLTHPSRTDGCPEEEIGRFNSLNQKIQEGKLFSSLDGIVDWDTLVSLIKEHDEHYRIDEVIPTGHNKGWTYDYMGRAFERDIANMLSDRANFLKWKGCSCEGGKHYHHFKMIMEKIHASPEMVKSIKATAKAEDIGDLPTGGAPKTDVLVELMMEGGQSRIVTFSCKRMNGKEVTAHQYTADAFADVLDANNNDLRYALKCFQYAGNFEDMPKSAYEMLEKGIKPHVKKLCRWVVGGYGGSGEFKHMAQFLISFRTCDNRFAIHSTEEYVDILMSLKSRKKPGTPFSWTYQGKRGRNIQLKMPVVF